jgi:murein DD-endopeptidase MepM/ murein hydrolase activator NlpD
MFGTLVIGGILAAGTALVVMEWKRAKSDELRRAGITPSAPGKAGPGAVFDTRVQEGGLAHHIVDLGRFGRGMIPDRRTLAGAVTPHNGIDITAPTLTPVRAAMNGRVVRADPIEGYGTTVVLSHPQTGESTVYGHLSRALVTIGQQVGGGDLVGLVGNSCSVPGREVPCWCRQTNDARCNDPRTGRNTSRTMGSHLHFEVHPSPTPNFSPTARRTDPVRWLRDKHIEMFAWELPRALDSTLQNFGDL